MTGRFDNNPEMAIECLEKMLRDEETSTKTIIGRIKRYVDKHCEIVEGKPQYDEPITNFYHTLLEKRNLSKEEFNNFWAEIGDSYKTTQ